MPYDWGPHVIVPARENDRLRGTVVLRERRDRQLLGRELAELGLRETDAPVGGEAANPWSYRPKGAASWIKIGESRDERGDFAMAWDTTKLPDGEYEVKAEMHSVAVGEEGKEFEVFRERIIPVVIANRG